MNLTSPLDGYRDEIEALLSQKKSYRQIADILDIPTSERSLRRAIKRWGIRGNAKTEETPNWESPGLKVNGDEAHISTDPREWKNYLNNTDDLLIQRDLNPDDWEIASVIVNEWDWHGQTYKQLKVHLKRIRKLEMIVPARIPLKKTWVPTSHVLAEDEPMLVVFASDQHCPGHDLELHKRFCEFLYQQLPEQGVLLGDTLDLPNISRHAPEPEWAPSTQECVDAGGGLLHDIRQASPVTQWRKLPGNHEERLRRSVIDRLADFYALSPAHIEGLPDLPPIYDPVHLLRLDELGFEYVRPKGKYDHGIVKVTPYLAARHGWIARKGAGSSALHTLDHLGHSVLVGHTHRQSIVHQTKHDIDGETSTRVAAEIGCMCRIDKEAGGHYTPAPDWQQGFATASVWPDGTFKIDLATFVHKHLYWRNERY